jgi:hypothetical protein
VYDIDSKLAYNKDNIQLIDKRLNLAKHKLGQQKFIELCRLVVEYNNGL